MWDRVRIEPSATEPGHADLFLMAGDQRAVDIVIAHLPMFGVPARASIADDEDWRFMLDVLAGINAGHGGPESVWVDASSGETWEHRPAMEAA